MAFNIKNNYGPNIDVHDGGVVNLQQRKDGSWQTDDDVDVEEAEIVEELTDEVTETEESGKEDASPKKLNYFAPQKNLEEFLKESWFRAFRTKDDYDEKWTNGFVTALMASEWRDSIAADWTAEGRRSKVNQLKGYVVGLLADGGVLKGSYDSIAAGIGITENAKTFSRYMSDGKKQPYAEFVKDYVAGTEKQ